MGRGALRRDLQRQPELICLTGRLNEQNWQLSRRALLKPGLYGAEQPGYLMTGGVSNNVHALSANSGASMAPLELPFIVLFAYHQPAGKDF